MRSLFSCLLLTFFACGHAKSETKSKTSDPVIDSLTIPAIPEWTDRYADGKQGDVRFFNLSEVMRRFKVDRLGAVEIQNTYRDLTRANPDMAGDKGLMAAVKRVQSGTLESGIDRDELQKAPFIVVFDLDETLYDQYYGGGDKCHSVAYRRSNGKMKYIHMVPGWAETIRSVVEMGGRVVLFSANLDKTTLDNLAQIKLDGQPLTASPLISGIMTNSHLTQQEKTEAPGSPSQPRKGRPVVEPSKDLRHFDPSLERVIIVDDNPLRLFQFQNIRVFKKFHADTYCKTTDPVLKNSYDRAMSVVVAEITETVSYMKANPNTGFKVAYLPYTPLGQTAMTFLMTGQTWTADKARAHLRKNPSIVDKRY
ncbi:MAG: hypothetical protein CMH52_12900 [Myxococcales bacterium]|nr:hypothetical protein [Myxococcales bacterium]